MHHRRKKHSARRRRRHVGAFKLKAGSTGLKLAAVAGGFFLGKGINEAIDKLIAKASPTSTTTTTTTAASSNTGTIASVAEIGVGGLLLMRKGGGKMAMPLTIAGGILAGAGLRRVIGQLGFMNGFQSVPVIGRHRMAGYQSVPVIGQRVVPPQLAGPTVPPQLMGFRVNGGMGAYTPTGSGVMGKIGAVDGGSGITNSGGGGYMG